MKRMYSVVNVIYSGNFTYPTTQKLAGKETILMHRVQESVVLLVEIFKQLKIKMLQKMVSAEKIFQAQNMLI